MSYASKLILNNEIDVGVFVCILHGDLGGGGCCDDKMCRPLCAMGDGIF